MLTIILTRYIKKLVAIKKLTPLKITQTSGANSEHKHSKIEPFSTLNEQISHKTPSLSISSVTCTNQSLQSVVSVQQQWADDV